MGYNYLFSPQPTFTQGLILGQLSILLLLVLILKYLFLDSTRYPLKSSYQTQVDTNFSLRQRKVESPESDTQMQGKGAESTEWLNLLFQQVADVYRSKLRDDLPGTEGDEVVRKRVEEYANRIRPPGFLDHIKIHSVDLGVSAPRLYNARIHNQMMPKPSTETAFDATYTDTLSISLSTSYLFNYPMTCFARLPVSLTISLSQFKSSVNLTPPSPVSATPVLTITLPPEFSLDLTSTSLIGSRAKLANIPKLHELVQHHVRRLLATRRTWTVVLPGFSSSAEVRDEVKQDVKEELF